MSPQCKKSLARSVALCSTQHVATELKGPLPGLTAHVAGGVRVGWQLVLSQNVRFGSFPCESLSVGWAPLPYGHQVPRVNSPRPSQMERMQMSLGSGFRRHTLPLPRTY